MTDEEMKECEYMNIKVLLLVKSKNPIRKKIAENLIMQPE